MKYSEYSKTNPDTNMAIATEVYMNTVAAPIGTLADMAEAKHTTEAQLIDDAWGDIIDNDNWGSTDIGSLYLYIWGCGLGDESDGVIFHLLGKDAWTARPKEAATVLMEIWGYVTEYASAVEDYNADEAARQKYGKQAELLAAIATDVKNEGLRKILTAIVTQ